VQGRGISVPSLTSSSERRAMVAGSLKATLAFLYVIFRLGYLTRSAAMSCFGSGTPQTMRRCPSIGVSPPMVLVVELMGSVWWLQMRGRDEGSCGVFMFLGENT
jgi:hypothetical protein